MTNPQASITAFWSTVAPGYEAHGGNVAEYGTEAYEAWVDAIRAVLPAMLARGSGYLIQTASMAGILTSHGNSPLPAVAVVPALLAAA